jgi:hypothetical protein
MRWCVGAEGRAVRDNDAVAVWACRTEGRSDLVIEDDILVVLCFWGKEVLDVYSIAYDGDFLCRLSCVTRGLGVII